MSQRISVDDKSDGILKRGKEGALEQQALLSAATAPAARAPHGSCVLKKMLRVQWRSVPRAQGLLPNRVEQSNKSSKNRLPVLWE